MASAPVEKYVDESLEQYSLVYSESIYDANKYLSTACMTYLGVLPYRDILYTYKKVLLRHQL